MWNVVGFNKMALAVSYGSFVGLNQVHVANILNAAEHKFDVSRLEGARSINKYFTVAHLALYLVNTGVGGNRFKLKVCRKKRK